MGRKKKEVAVDKSGISKENKTVSLILLEKQRSALYAIAEFFDTAAKHLSSIDDIELQAKISINILKASKDIGPAIESLNSLEEKVQREEMESISRKGDTATSLFEE
jgi:hypothetical protein